MGVKGEKVEPISCRVHVGLNTLLKLIVCSVSSIVVPAPCRLISHQPTRRNQVCLALRSSVDIFLHLSTRCRAPTSSALHTLPILTTRSTVSATFPVRLPCIRIVGDVNLFLPFIHVTFHNPLCLPFTHCTNATLFKALFMRRVL